MLTAMRRHALPVKFALPINTASFVLTLRLLVPVRRVVLRRPVSRKMLAAFR